MCSSRRPTADHLVPFCYLIFHREAGVREGEAVCGYVAFHSLRAVHVCRKAGIVENIIAGEEDFHPFQVPSGEHLLEPPADQGLVVFGHNMFSPRKYRQPFTGSYVGAKRSLKRASTTGQGSSQCLSVMVTMTVFPSIRYSPLTNLWTKRPDPSSPTKVAPFSLAALLALASSEAGVALVCTLKVLAIVPSCSLRQTL